jgi:hypothetical protein
VSIELQVLPLIISLIVAVSLHIARGFFEEAKEAHPIVDSHAIDSLGKLTSNVLREMQDDVERFLYLAEPPDGLGENYHAYRRGETANQITLMIWDGAKKQKDLENAFNSWSYCEEGGRFICGIGTFLNLAVLVCLLAIVIFRPSQIVINNYYIWIVLSIIAFPILCALVCYLVAFGYKRKFFNMRDR